MREYDFTNAQATERHSGADELDERECRAQLRLLNALGSASKDARWGKHGEQFFGIVRKALDKRLEEIRK